MIEYQAIWEEVIFNFQCSLASIHGPSHWKRVERNGLQIATDNGADQDVVKLFAVLHDARRFDDDEDIMHGDRAAKYAETMRAAGKLSDLDDGRFNLLQDALRRHAHGGITDSPTIGACWDADRQDLWRVGIIPATSLMSTDAGRRLAATAMIEEP
jgi:uncharacterized protein